MSSTQLKAKLFLIFSLAAIPSLINAQLFSSQAKLNSIPPWGNQIKFSPLKLVDPYAPGLELSYQRVHKKAVQFERLDARAIATQLSISYLHDFTQKNPNRILEGYRIGVEEKFYVGAGRKSKLYLSTEVLFMKGRTKDMVYDLDSALHRINVDSFLIKKHTAAINLKGGAEFHLGQLIIDIGIGAGLKYRVVKHFDRTRNLNTPRRSEWVSDTFIPGTTYTINLPITFRVGYSF